jgi:hypothetical protein
MSTRANVMDGETTRPVTVAELPNFYLRFFSGIILGELAHPDQSRCNSQICDE